MNKAIILLIFIFLFISCSDKIKNDKLKQIDSLITQIDSLKSNLASIDIDSVNLIIDETEYIVQKFIKLKPEDQSKEEIKLFGYSGDIHKTCSRFMGAYNLTQKEILYSERQLNDLKHDIEYDLLKDSMFTVYYEMEKKIVSGLNTGFYLKFENFKDKLELHKIIDSDLSSMYLKLKAIPDTIE